MKPVYRVTLSPAKRLLPLVERILKENRMKRVLGILLAFAVMVGMTVAPGFSQDKKDEKAAKKTEAKKGEAKKGEAKKAEGKAEAKKGAPAADKKAPASTDKKAGAKKGEAKKTTGKKTDSGEKKSDKK